MADHTYTNVHRLFVQSLLSHQILNEDKALEIYEQVCTLANAQPTDFALFVGEINHRINEYDMALRRGHDQQSGQEVIAFVNTKPDDLAQLATRYDANQITFLRRLIEMIVMADDEAFSVRSLAAIQLGQRMEPTMTSRATEEFLDQLVADRWLVVTSSGVYGIGTRALLELAGYLRDQFPDAIKECLMCTDLVTIGERCDLQPCAVRIHLHCAEQLFVNNQRPLVCPECSTAWSRSNTIGLSQSQTGFKKNLNRAGQSIMQKTGVAEKSIDGEFAEEYDRFQRLEHTMDKLSKEAKGYQNSFRALGAAQSRIAETMQLFFEDAPPVSFQHYQQAIQHMDTKMKSDADEAYSITVIEPLARYCAAFPDVNEAIKRRQKKLLDYESHRLKVRKLVEKPSDDPQRLPMAEKEADLARDMYENINTILVQDLPTLVALRVPYLDPSFEAMVKTQWRVGQLAYDHLEGIRASFPSTTDDRRVDTVLQQMRSLSICGNV